MLPSHHRHPWLTLCPCLPTPPLQQPTRPATARALPGRPPVPLPASLPPASCSSWTAKPAHQPLPPSMRSRARFCRLTPSLRRLRLRARRPATHRRQALQCPQTLALGMTQRCQAAPAGCWRKLQWYRGRQKAAAVDRVMSFSSRCLTLHPATTACRKGPLGSGRRRSQHPRTRPMYLWHSSQVAPVSKPSEAGTSLAACICQIYGMPVLANALHA